MTQAIDQTGPPPSAALLAGYAPLPDAFDECVDQNGSIRPAWQDALARWDGQSDAERSRRHQAANRYLQDNGVAHRIYGDDQSVERPWPLSHMPLILGADEWAWLENGLKQRADLLEQVVADLYGPQNLVRDGHLPATLVAGSPGFLRPLVGVKPKGGHHLHYIAIELGRGPDGRWWVLGDRTQAPSGAGYALENRMATRRAMGGDLRSLRVRRLAEFFQHFRETMSALREAQTARVGLLTPGPYNETYYEQAFLARYLGFLLLEGGDLIIQDKALFIRTVRGLKQVDVLWRRLDAEYCDPLELKADSRLGVPGLVQVVRTGGLTCVNALGAGLLESRWFMAFLPALARQVNGEDLAIPNIATWWRGDPAMRSSADQASGDRVNLGAFGTGLPMDGAVSSQGWSAATSDRETVTQESVRLSTMPAFENDTHGDLVPRPFTLRVFLARSGDGWTVLPGGFCRVADSDDTRALSMRDGSRSCDVWVRSAGPVSPVTLLPKPGTRGVRRVPGTLPARAADNLFWLGRYMERAQLVSRLARAGLARRADTGHEDDALLGAIDSQLSAWGVVDLTSPTLFADQLHPGFRQAHRAASAIRDRFSPDAWQTLNRFMTEAIRPQFRQLSRTEQIDEALLMLAAFAGLIGENMIRLSGWRFLEIGRRLERALGTCRLTQTFAYPSVTDGRPPDGAFDLLLDVADSVMSYRQRYSITTDRNTVVDLVMLDPNNPRSVAFQLDKIHLHVNEITDHQAFEALSDLQRLAFSTWSQVHGMRVEQVDTDRLASLQNDLAAMSETISRTFISPSSVGDPASS